MQLEILFLFFVSTGPMRSDFQVSRRGKFLSIVFQMRVNKNHWYLFFEYVIISIIIFFILFFIIIILGEIYCAIDVYVQTYDIANSHLNLSRIHLMRHE